MAAGSTEGCILLETRIRRKDGTTREVEVSATVTEFKGERQFFCMCHDITESKRTEEALGEGEAKLKEAQRVAHIGNWEWNATNNTIFWSEELCRLLNFNPNMPMPNYKEHLKLYAPESMERLDAAVKKALQGGEPYDLDLELASPDATRRWIGARGEVLRSGDGTIIGLRGTAQNITERKRNEE